MEVAVPSNVVRRLYRDLIDEVFETTWIPTLDKEISKREDLEESV